MVIEMTPNASRVNIIHTENCKPHLPPRILVGEMIMVLRCPKAARKILFLKGQLYYVSENSNLKGSLDQK